MHSRFANVNLHASFHHRSAYRYALFAVLRDLVNIVDLRNTIRRMRDGEFNWQVPTSLIACLSVCGDVVASSL
jgi:hypothetical protein